jgi:hypothetical protein
MEKIAFCAVGPYGDKASELMTLSFCKEGGVCAVLSTRVEDTDLRL